MEKLYYKYAELLLKRCLNITKSQPLFISKPSGDIQILPKIVEIANQLGIDDIYIETRDSFVQHDILKHINVEHIKHCDAFNSEIWDEYAKKNAAFLYLDTEYPGLMDDIETAKLTEAELNIRKTKPIYKEK